MFELPRSAMRLITAVLAAILAVVAVGRVWARNADGLAVNRALAAVDLWRAPSATDLDTLIAWLERRDLAPLTWLVFAHKMLANRADGAALGLGQAVQARDPATADPHYLAGLIHTAQGDWPQAAADFARARKAPQRRQVGVSDIELAAGKAAIMLLSADAVDWPQVRGWLETAAAAADYRFDTGPVARIETSYFLGLARQNTQDPAGALQAYDAALALDPTNYWSNVNSALLLWQTFGDHVAAIGRLQKARAARPDLFAAYIWSARLLCTTGDRDGVADLVVQARLQFPPADLAALLPSLACSDDTPAP